jgi:trimethylamine--corrinoid protein Co-methyltransferase
VSNPTHVLPHLSVLSLEQIEQVHAYSLEILARVGLRVDSPRAAEVLRKSEGVKFLNADHAVFQPELVEWAIATTPSAIEVFNRPGELAFRLGADRTRFGVGVTNLYYQDPLTDEITLFTRELFGRSVRLAGDLPAFDLVSTVGILRDVDVKQADLYATLEMVANTYKPLVLLISDEKQFAPALDMLGEIHGDLAEKPFTIPYFNPVSPLILNLETANKMFTAIERGLPFIYSNYGMVGMSTPVTPAGTLALLTAELLAGLVFSQLVKPGTPVILGSLPAYFDMKTMVDFYDPQTMLLNLACAEMMAHYKVPHAGTSGSGNGWGGDILASGALWSNHLTACLGVVGLAPFVGGALTSKVFSPTAVVYSNEIIEQSLLFARGFPIDEEASAMDDILEAGPGGHFLMSDRTYRMFRTAYHMSSIFPRWSLEKWEEEGSPKSDTFLRQKTAELVEGAQPPEDGEEILSRGEEFIKKTANRNRVP